MTETADARVEFGSGRTRERADRRPSVENALADRDDEPKLRKPTGDEGVGEKFDRHMAAVGKPAVDSGEAIGTDAARGIVEEASKRFEEAGAFQQGRIMVAPNGGRQANDAGEYETSKEQAGQHCDDSREAPGRP
jgi:hypothetical protein